MAMCRYEIRNEYSLADPGLYRAADKDDPEALLEGVAMAGLAGILRQLGDLAEFAAEIFHNLHEEVMLTSSRGHGLMTRVQHLETEVRFIEKAFLPRTDHSSFFYNAGVDWHPNLRIYRNRVTQGNLPRFVMDSYEECRAPPRLFLLDKFDVAGDGACLKRYTDPSIFKVETAGMTADVQREKKSRKAKKKGLRWRNRENSEVLPTSHAKLHQLFLEERVENGASNPSHRAKLRRRLNGFPFDSKSRNSYMEKLLNSPSPDYKVRHEMIENSSPPLMSSINDTENMETSRSPSPSPDREEVMLDPPTDDKIYVGPNSCPSIDKVIFEKVKTVDTESKREDSLNGYQSDDITCETGNYLKAPSTIESGKEISSSLFSNSPSTSAENPQSEKTSPKRFPSAEIPEVELIDVSSYQKPADEVFPVDQNSQSMISGYICSNTGANTDHLSEIDLAFSSDSEGVVGKGGLWGLEPDEMASTLAKEENKTELVIHSPSSPDISNPESQFKDDSPRSSNGEHLMEEPNVENLPCVSNVSHMMDNSVTISADLLHEDQSYCEDHNLAENMPSMLNMYDVVPYQNSNCSSEITESLIEGKLEDEVPEVRENVSSNYPDIANSGANIESTVSKEEYPVVESDNEDSNVFTVAQKCSPCIMEDSSGRALEETSFANDETVDSEENHSDTSIGTQLASEIKLSNLESSLNFPPEGVDALDRDIIPEEETASTSDTVENNRITLSTSPSGLKITEISVSVDLKSLNEVHNLSDESNSDTHKAKSAHSSALHAASDYTKKDGVGLPVGINKLVEEQITCCEELVNDMNCLSGSYMVSGLVEEVDQTEGVESNSKSDVSDTVLSHRDLDIEQECLQENGLANHVAGPSLPIDDDIEESALHEQIELPQLPDSSEISSELSPQTPIKQQILEHDDHKELNDSASITSLVSYANPPSASDIPRVSNHDINFAENPKDSLGSIFPSNQRTNQINLDKLPPLPPPPVQWIMGKLQHAPSTTEDERTKPEQFPREIITSDHQFITPTSDSESTSAAKADGVSTGSRAMRLPRPDNPRKDYVAAIDKRRLRKVTERVRPEIQKLDEKDSFLEQIRAKSFNLKPAVASRPSIQGPKTNLNVAAILEKANAIRQAFADNGDDDEDSWSDS